MRILLATSRAPTPTLPRWGREHSCDDGLPRDT